MAAVPPDRAGAAPAADRTPSLRRLGVFTALVVLAETVLLTALTPLLPDLERELGLSDVGIGLVVAGYSIGIVGATLPAALIANRHGVRGITTLGLLLLAGSTVAFAFADSAALAVAARIIQGLAGAGCWAGAMTWLVVAAPVSRRGEAIGFVMAFTVAGSLLGPLLGGVASELGREPVFLATGVVALALAAGSRVVPPPAAVPQQPLDVLWRTLRRADVLAVMGIVGLSATVVGVVWTLVPTDMAAAGWASTAISATFVAAAFAEMVIGPVAGRWFDRSGALRPLGVGLALTAVLVAALAAGVDGWRLPVVVAALGVPFGLMISPAFALLTRRRERHGLRDALGIVTLNLSFAPGFIVGPLLAGVAAETVGRPAAYVVLIVVLAGTLAAVTARGRLD